MTTILKVRGLGCRRGGRLLFDGFDLDLGPSEVVWLRAANGYGKTSLLRILVGLSRPENGTIAWADDPAAQRGGSRVYLAHANALKEDLTIVESVADLVRLHGLDASAAAQADAIRRLGLASRRHAFVRTLSQGQRRRVALSRLCLTDPRATWLLDEPYDALDADGTATVAALLGEHVARGGSALLTSHVVPDAAGPPLRTVQLDAPGARAA